MTKSKLILGNEYVNTEMRRVVDSQDKSFMGCFGEWCLTPSLGSKSIAAFAYMDIARQLQRSEQCDSELTD